MVFSTGYAAKEKLIHGTLATNGDQLGRGKLPFENLLYVGDFLEKSVTR